MKRTFTYQDEKSNKFWMIEINENQFTVSYGKIGTAAQTSSKAFENAEKCLKEAEKLIAEKTKKGYVEQAADTNFAGEPKAEKPLQKVIREFTELTAIPTIQLKTKKAQKPLSPYTSKFGGIPYLPQGFSYPVSTNSYPEFNDPKNPNPLKLLAQINFEEMPHLPDFPEKGILQFYLDPKDDMCASENDTNSYKVFYHAEVDHDESTLQQPPAFDLDEDENYFPVGMGEYALTPILTTQPMTPYDFHFDKLFMSIFKKYFTGEEYEDAESYLDLDEYDEIADKLDSLEHRIGGYASGSQEDAREDEAEKHTTVLLQIDTDDKYDEIMWGDCGTGTFFIKPNDLKKRKFSDVFFNWDCC